MHKGICRWPPSSLPSEVFMSKWHNVRGIFSNSPVSYSKEVVANNVAERPIQARTLKSRSTSHPLFQRLPAIPVSRLPSVYSRSRPPAAYLGSGQKQDEPSERRFKTLSNRTFWALVAITLVLIIAAGLSHRTGAASAAQTQTSTNSSFAKSTTSYLNSETTNTANPATNTNRSSIEILLTRLTNPLSTGSPSALIRDCPSSGNTLYSAHIGSANFEFRKICSEAVVITGNTLTVNSPTPNLDECTNQCAGWNANRGTPPCDAVGWRSTFRGINSPGVCYGFQTTNTSTGFAIEPQDTMYSSAIWINQS
jgi:hypothetical protein